MDTRHQIEERLRAQSGKPMPPEVEARIRKRLAGVQPLGWFGRLDQRIRMLSSGQMFVAMIGLVVTATMLVALFSIPRSAGFLASNSANVKPVTPNFQTDPNRKHCKPKVITGVLAPYVQTPFEWPK